MIAYSLVLLLTPASFLLARIIQSRLALPLLSAIAVYFPFLMEAQNSLSRGFLLVLTWTILLSAMVLWYTIRNPERAGNLIWRSRDYTAGMMRWIETGNLPEGGAAQVVFFHLRQGFLYAILAIFTANFMALMAGAALLNYMNYYVAIYAGGFVNKKWNAFLLAWNPWSLIRVVAYLYLGIALSTPALWLLITVPWRFDFWLFAPGFAGVLLDIVLKIGLSKRWAHMLRAHQRKEASTSS